MVWGRKRTSSGFPADTAERMAEFGQFEFSPMDSNLNSDHAWSHLQSPYLLALQQDPTDFISTLADLVLQSGGWSAYGAHKTIASLVGPGTTDPDYAEIVDSALTFLRSEGISVDHLNDYEQ